MTGSLVDRIAKAVLYEGYLLYPYRPSAVKNRRRFNFGVLAPRRYCEAQPTGEVSSLHLECLVRGGSSANLDVRLRFLHLATRDVAKFPAPVAALPAGRIPEHRLVPSLEIDGQLFEAWQDAVEREFAVRAPVDQLVSAPLERSFHFSGGESIDPLGGAESGFLGAFLRRQEALAGELRLGAEPLRDELFKVTLEISNVSPLPSVPSLDRDGALLHSFVSTHAVLESVGGEFISLLDPPAALESAARTCRNQGVWPVLVGEEGDGHILLASPIILYDYPQVAPESPGDLFDGAEIDEILSLRILTLTDDEKREMRHADERARQILARTENLPEEQLMKLHGALRTVRSRKGELA
jgi:hydrogenase maturation protease